MCDGRPMGEWLSSAGWYLPSEVKFCADFYNSTGDKYHRCLWPQAGVPTEVRWQRSDAYVGGIYLCVAIWPSLFYSEGRSRWSLRSDWPVLSPSVWRESWLLLTRSTSTKFRAPALCISKLWCRATFEDQQRTTFGRGTKLLSKVGYRPEYFANIQTDLLRWC